MRGEGNTRWAKAAAAALAVAGCGDEPPEAIERGPPEVAIAAPSTMEERSSARVSAHARDRRVEVESWRWFLRQERGTGATLESTAHGEARLTTRDVVGNTTVQVGVVARTRAGFETTELTEVRIEEVDAGRLPRDPELAGRKSLLGIDSNENAIRDDVERAIYERHAESRLRMDLLGSGAQAIQRILATSVATGITDPGAGAAYERYRVCMVNYSGTEARAEMQWLEAKMLDNEKRHEAWERHAESQGPEAARVHAPVVKAQCLESVRS